MCQASKHGMRLKPMAILIAALGTAGAGIPLVEFLFHHADGSNGAAGNSGRPLCR